MKPPRHHTVEIDGERYVPIWWMESMHQRKHWTIRTWINRGMLAHVIRSGTVYVHYDDAIRLHVDPKHARRKPRLRKRAG